jgi:uncharacterized protein YbbK (DUF523 family)
MTKSRTEASKPRLGISACLLGEHVRYDGGDKLDRYLRDVLGEFVEWVPVCPEAECGLSVPREAMRLAGNPNDPRLVTQKTGVDHTERMKEWAAKRLAELDTLRLDGFVLKARSPSCGLRVEVFDAPHRPHASAAGLFARALAERFGDLPLSEDEPLRDPRAWKGFLARVTARRDGPRH